MDYKICSKCKELKPLNDFEKSNSCKDGHRGTCKKCRQQQKTKITNYNAKCVGKNSQALEKKLNIAVKNVNI